MAIEIDPKTGAPILKPLTTPINPIAEPPVPSGFSVGVGDGSAIGKPSTQVLNKIEEAKQFNKEMPLVIPGGKYSEIEEVLRGKGMDSQQRTQALAMIREILES